MTVVEFINKVLFKVDQSSINQVNNAISGIKSTATKLLGAIGIGFSLTQLNTIAEEFDGIGDRLSYAVGNAENLDEIQKSILASANNCRAAYGSMVDTVTSLKQANSTVFPLEEAATFVEYTTKLGKAAGYSDSEISTMQNSLQRIVAAGTAGASDITRILRSTPALAEQLAKALGTDTTGLVQLATQGKITAQTLKNAMNASADDIDKAFANLNFGVSDALLQIRNKFGVWVDETNKQFALTQTIAKTMVSSFNTVMGVLNKVRNGVVWLSDKLGGTDKLLRLIAISAGAIFTAMNGGKILSFLSTATIKLAAIAAVVVLIALLVEDFINFMQGNDSLLGSLLEKAGVYVDAVRQKIIDAWTAIKKYLLAAWDAIKAACSAVWGAIKNFFATHGDQVKAALVTAWNVIKTALSAVWNIIKTIATTIFGGLLSFWQKHGEQVKASFTNIWTGIKEIFNGLKAFWETWGSTIVTYFTGVWNVIKAIFGTALDILSDLFAIFSDLFSGNWSQLWEDVKTLLSDIWNGIVNIISAYLEAAWSVISSVFSVIWEFISGIASSIWEAITTAFTNIWSSIVETVGNIKDSIVEGLTAAIDWIKALPAQALQWGKDIIMGIVDGIKGAVGKVGEAVSGVAGKIKSFLGFSEPEDGPLSDFHTYMPDMIDLMSKGIQAGREKIKGALGDLAGDMSVMTSANIVSGRTAAAVTSSTNTRTIVLNNTFNQQFSGDRAALQKSETAMRSAATDITSELARGLAYAR